MNTVSERIVVAIPAMDEAEWLPGCLESLAAQSVKGFQVVVCVNQPDGWWIDPDRVPVCRNNARTLQWLSENRATFPFRLHVVDCSSPGKGWDRGKGGAGPARKVAMDESARLSPSDGIIVSADADTFYPPEYLSAIAERLSGEPLCGALAAPYYHKLTGQKETDTAMLMYELFIRFHLLNMIRIESPYAFTAIGSAMAVTTKAYNRVGGVPPKPFGEDFYLLQKIAKGSRVIGYMQETAYPSARTSHRVAFGTGPAIEHYLAGEPDRYGIIAPEVYEPIREWYRMLPQLYIQDRPTPLDPFLKKTFGTSRILEPIRTNCRTIATFVKGCHQKMDGLRIWQMVREASANHDTGEALAGNLKCFLPRWHQALNGTLPSHEELIAIRDELFEKELQMRKANDEIM